MDTIFMNSKNGKKSDPQRLSLNVTDKTELRKKINILVYQISPFTIHGKR